MKKLYALLIFCFMNTVQADPLSDAIRSSDLKKVQKILHEKQLLEIDIAKGLALADEIINLKREEVLEARRILESFMGSSEIFSIVQPNLQELFAAFTGIIVTGVAANQYYANNKSGAITTCFLAWAIIYIGWADPLKRRFKNYKEQKHNEAIDIKMLLIEASHTQNQTTN